MATKLKVGVVGCGTVVRLYHLPAWQTVSDVEVAAACDVNLQTAKNLRRDFPIGELHEDYRKLIDDPEIDIIDVATPNTLHAPIVMEALEAGKHVLCEKPLATTSDSIRRIGEAAEKAKGILMVAQNLRFSPEAVAAKQFLEKQDLGAVYHARVHAIRRNLLPPMSGFIDPELSGGGPCMDIGVHALDLALWLMKFPKPVRVSGKTAVNFAKGFSIPGGWGEWDRRLFGVEDFACGFVHFESGGTMVVETSWLQHQKETEEISVMLFGTEGSLQWPSGEFSTAVNRVLVDGKVRPTTGLHPSHTEEVHAFVDAIRNGKPSPVPWNESLQVIKILEGIYKSSKLGREIEI
ncbi:MAG TPA: Gfo/Idh/MocA family oxidoreductase [Opitutales bacterium]|nr:Gfo/Idh/MocA family oxidoreductase [Opitutales bacterium]